MTRKEGWEKSTNGPDWIDVEMMMRAISVMHSGQVGLTVLPRGIGATGGLSTAVSIMWDTLPGSKITEDVAVIRDWPCSQHSTFAAHVFALLHELDFKIGQTYKNEKLWE